MIHILNLCVYPQVTTGTLSVDLQIHFGKHGSRVEQSCKMLEMSFQEMVSFNVLLVIHTSQYYSKRVI